MKIRSLFLTVLCAVAGLVSTASAAPADIRFAPEGTDLIIRNDGSRICRCEVFRKLRAMPEYQKYEKQAQAKLQKAGFTFDDLISADVCIFLDIDGFNVERPSVNVIIRTAKPLAKQVFKVIDAGAAEGKIKSKMRSEKIDGKEARVFENSKESFAIIALDDDLIQFSQNTGKFSALAKRRGNPLCDIIESDSMTSVAYKMSAATTELLHRLGGTQADMFVQGLTEASINVIDAGNSINFKAEFVYDADERAEDIRGALKLLLKTAQANAAKRDPKTDDLLKRINISGRGKKVIISFVCPNEQLVQLVSQLLK